MPVRRSGGGDRSGPSRSRPGLAVVTGATSGIGRALAVALAARGHPLLLIARREEALRRTAAELASEHGVEVDIRPCDLTDGPARAELAAELRACDIAVFCNNAGYGTFGDFVGVDPQRQHDEVALHVVAMHDLAAAVLPGMVRRNCGQLLLVGSVGGYQPVPGAATYAACKAFVNSLAESLHAELAGTGIVCTLLAPGPVRTQFARRAGVQDAANRLPRFVWVDPARAAEAALDGMAKGRRRVVPGVPAKVMAAAGSLVPHAATSPLLRGLIRRYV
jgi:uncharacterized protein